MATLQLSQLLAILQKESERLEVFFFFLHRERRIADANDLHARQANDNHFGHTVTAPISDFDSFHARKDRQVQLGDSFTAATVVHSQKCDC